MAILDFKPYAPNYIGKPVEQIGKMMETLDANNKRIGETYNKLGSVIDSLNIGDSDRFIVDNTRAQLESTIDKVANAQDYNTAEAELSKATRDFSNNPALRSAVARKADYDEKNALLEQLYYRGGPNAPTKEQYDYYKKKGSIFTATLPDEHGVYDNEYRDFEMPARSVEFNKEFASIAQMVAAESHSNNSVRYLTNAELAKATGIDPATIDNPTGNSSIIDYTTEGQTQTKSATKIADAIRKYATGDPDTKAFIEDLAKIRNKTAAELTEELMQPYLSAAYNSSEERIRYQSNDFMQKMQLNEFILKNKKKDESMTNIENATKQGFSMGDVVKVPKEINAVKPRTGFSIWHGKTYDDLDLTKGNSTDYYENIYINDAAKNMYNKSFNELDYNQREKVYDAIKQNNKIMTSDILAETKIVRPLDETGVFDAKTFNDTEKLVLGDGIKTVKFTDKENSGLSGLAAATGLYSIKDGKEIPAGEVNKYLAETYKKEENVGLIGNLSYNSREFAKITGNNEYNGAYVIKIGDDSYLVKSLGQGETRQHEELANDVKTGVDGIGPNKPRIFKTFSINGNKGSIAYMPGDDSYKMMLDGGDTSIIGKKSDNGSFDVTIQNKLGVQQFRTANDNYVDAMKDAYVTHYNQQLDGR